MIAHVAEAGEDRGRVVLHLVTGGGGGDVAVEAALRLAQAFQSEVESLFVEDVQLLDMAALPFVREVAMTGTLGAPVDHDRMALDLDAAGALLHRSVALAAREWDVPVTYRTVRGDCGTALAVACRERGPWNVVAPGKAVSGGSAEFYARLIDQITDLTGLVLTGTVSGQTSGPVVAVVEDPADVGPMLRAAERLASAEGARAIMLLAAEDPEQMSWLEGQVQLVLPEGVPVELQTAERAWGQPKALVEEIRRRGAGFVIAQYGGLLAARGQSLDAVLAALPGALFLVR